ncbi:hypothetical protein K438DRAFT_1867142 [Mycena galopus ATCC 62051]|nr:hypothetical protein K438DRAFT_1867142 [Mycena galopus ATCC 62051]
MYHPYSAPASYIYASEADPGTTLPPDSPQSSSFPQSSSYPSLDAHPKIQNRNIHSIQSTDSVPYSRSYSPQNTMTWTTDNTWTTEDTVTQFSEDDWPSVRDSRSPLIKRRAPVIHPYSQPLDSWIDEESVVEMPAAVSKLKAVVAAAPRPKRPAAPRERDIAPVRRSTFVPYEPRPFEERERERERERDKVRRAASWRRKIQRRVKRALRRLRRLLEGL